VSADPAYDRAKHPDLRTWAYPEHRLTRSLQPTGPDTLDLCAVCQRGLVYILPGIQVTHCTHCGAEDEVTIHYRRATRPSEAACGVGGCVLPATHGDEPHVFTLDDGTGRPRCHVHPCTLDEGHGGPCRPPTPPPLPQSPEPDSRYGGTR
jgi:hypothetical protein